MVVFFKSLLAFFSLNICKLVLLYANVPTSEQSYEKRKRGLKKCVHEGHIQGVPGGMCQTSGGCSLC